MSVEVINPLSLRLTPKKRCWFWPAFKVLWAICVCADLVSSRLAGVISDVSCTILARCGIKYAACVGGPFSAPLRKKDPPDPSR